MGNFVLFVFVFFWLSVPQEFLKKYPKIILKHRKRIAKTIPVALIVGPQKQWCPILLLQHIICVKSNKLDAS